MDGGEICLSWTESISTLSEVSLRPLGPEDRNQADALLKVPQMKAGLEKLGVPDIKNLRVVRPGDASIVPVNDDLTWAQ